MNIGTLLKSTFIFQQNNTGDRKTRRFPQQKRTGISPALSKNMEDMFLFLYLAKIVKLDTQVHRTLFCHMSASSL